MGKGGDGLSSNLAGLLEYSRDFFQQKSECPDSHPRSLSKLGQSFEEDSAFSIFLSQPISRLGEDIQPAVCWRKEKI